MEVSRSNFKCSQCGLSFLFENTLLLHTQNIHKNSDLSITIGSVESNVSQNIGERISIVVGLQQTVQTVSPPKRKEMVFSTAKRGKGGGSEKCSKCSFRTRNLSLLLEHQLLEHRKKAVPIFYCGYQTCWFPFSNKRERHEHEKEVHGQLAPPPFFCNICRRRFQSWGPIQMRHHEKCSKKTVFRCPASPTCSFQTKRRAVLQKHVQTNHFECLSRYRKEQYEVKTGDTTVKQEKIEVERTESGAQQRLMSSEYYEEADDDKLEDVKLLQNAERSRGQVCPFDERKFSSLESLHTHLHSAHLDTGIDSLDCPLGQDTFYCFCGRKTNCRQSLVIHVMRCQVNNTAEVPRPEVVSDPEAGSLATRRKAARRCRELGIRDSRPSKDERLKRSQMKMCRQLIGKQGDESDEEVEVLDDDESEEEEDEYVDDPAEIEDLLGVYTSDEAEEESRPLDLSSAKRKSCTVLSQPRKKRGQVI